MIFVRRFSSEGHTRRFSVERDALVGWAAREEEDNQVVKVIRSRDWHRVEQMIAMFDLKALALRDQGWQEIGANI
jgi:hypothetical protein